MAKQTHTKQQNDAGQDDHGPICAKCGTGSFPRGFCESTGLCWTCQFERTPAEFAQMAADTVLRRASFDSKLVLLAA